MHVKGMLLTTVTLLAIENVLQKHDRAPIHDDYYTTYYDRCDDYYTIVDYLDNNEGK